MRPDPTSAAHSSSNNRFFPPLDQHFYEIRDSKSAANKLLNLVNVQLSNFKKASGRGLSLIEQFARLFILHKNGLEAELEAKEKKADFFWTELGHLLKKKVYTAALWERLLNTLDVDPSQIPFPQFMEEIFVATHLKFYKTFQAMEDKLDRSSKHFEYFEEMIRSLDYSPERKLSLLNPILSQQVFAHKEAKEWEEVARKCKKAIHEFGQNKFYEDELIHASYQNVTSKITQGKGIEADKKEVRVLNMGINELSNLDKKYPDRLFTYYYLSDLYLLHSIKLSNTGQLSGALLDARKAVVYDPNSKEARNNFVTMLQRMKQLQEQVHQVRAKLKYNQQLTPEGEKLFREARIGFNQLERFTKSGEEEEILAKRKIAQAKAIWQEIGLEEETDAPNDKPLMLFEALDPVFAKRPQNRLQMEAAWEQQLEANRLLADIDRGKVIDFLERKILNLPPTTEPENQEVTEVEPEARFTIANDDKGGDSPPFDFWLFNLKDARVKLQAVAGIFLILFAGLLFGKKSWNLYQRNQAYKTINESSLTQDHLLVIEASEQFLSSPPLKGEDFRKGEVEEMYHLAFSKWFLERQDSLGKKDFVRIDKYKKLMAKN